MTRRFSIAEARDQFASLVRDVEESSAVEITRRGKTVAVLLSWREFQRLSSEKKFWDRYAEFRQQTDLASLGIDDEVFENLRDLSPGRQVAE